MRSTATDSRHTFKVVVAGSFACGKTTLIRQISDSDVVGTEAPTSGLEADVKTTTTVGMEFGTHTVGSGADAVTLSLFGVPGQERFRFMWDIVSSGADGFLVLADASRPDTWAETAEMAAHLRSRNRTPMLLGVNRAQQDDELFHRVTTAISVPGMSSLACDVTDRRSTVDALVSLLLSIDAALEVGAEAPHAVAHEAVTPS